MGMREDLIEGLRAADSAGNKEDAAHFAQKLQMMAEPLTDYSRQIIADKPLSGKQLFADRALEAFQGGTLGWGDEVEGVIGGLDSLVRGKNSRSGKSSFGEGYDATVKSARSDQSQYEKERPLEALGLQAAGGLPLAAVGGASALSKTSLAKRVLTAAKVGAGYGAVSGAGSANEGDRVEGGVIGGLAGAGLGAALPLVPTAVKGVTKAVRRSVQKPENFAADYLAHMLEGDPLPQVTSGKTLIETGGEGSIAAAEQSALSGVGRKTAKNFFDNADKSREGDLVGQIKKTISDKGLYDTLDEMTQKRAVDAHPLYLDAYAAPYRRTPKLLDLSKRPAVGGAARAAITRVLNDPDLNPDEVRAAMEPIFGNNVEGLSDAQLQQRLTQALGQRPVEFKVLDYIKRGLDNLAESPEASKEIRKLRGAWREELKAVNPKYGEALNAWAGPSRVLEALEEGRNFHQADPEAIERLMGEMGDSEREAYQIGVSRRLQDWASGASSKTPGQRASLSLADAIAGNQVMQKRLTASLGSAGAAPETILARNGWKPVAGGYVNTAKPGQVLNFDKSSGRWSLSQNSKSGKSSSLLNAGADPSSLEFALTGRAVTHKGPQSVDDLINLSSSMVDTAKKKSAIIGGSPTGRRLAGIDDFGNFVADTAKAAAGGHVGIATHFLARAWGRIANGLTDERRAAVAKLLFSQDPVEQQKGIDMIQRIRSGKKALYQPGIVPAITGELIGPPSGQNN